MIGEFFNKLINAFSALLAEPIFPILLGILVILLAFTFLKRILGKFFWIIVIIGILLLLGGVIRYDTITNFIQSVGDYTKNILSGIAAH